MIYCRDCENSGMLLMSYGPPEICECRFGAAIKATSWNTSQKSRSKPLPPQKVNITPAIEREAAQMRAAALAKLLREMPADEVAGQIKVVLADRQDWTEHGLKGVHDVLADLLWEIVG